MAPSAALCKTAQHVIYEMEEIVKSAFGRTKTPFHDSHLHRWEFVETVVEMNE